MKESALVSSIRSALSEAARPDKARELARFFKTGPAEYGEGDVFIGVMVPEQRKVAKRFRGQVGLEDILQLIESPVHEHRLTAIIMMVELFASAKRAGDRALSEQIYSAYINQIGRGINNWDLVDISAGKVVGAYLKDKDRGVLYELAISEGLWHRRVAMIACSAFIDAGDFEDALKIAELLLRDTHDLIHKAVGWMLREIGKRDEATLLGFLDQHAASMPRTALRYSIERLPEDVRKHWKPVSVDIST